MRREIVVLRGRVQGVGFRDRVVDLARRSPIFGTVRNLRGGSLEIDIEGEPEAVEAFVAAVLANPPRNGRIDEVERTVADLRGISGFSRMPTD